MASSSFSPKPEWHWPQDIHASAANIDSSAMPGSFSEEPTPPSNARSSPKATPDANATPKSARHWPPRTCRICLETVLPTYETPSGNIPDILQPRPSVTYISSDPESGRLIRPCKCKGSSRYVHEGCLQAWRHADPAYGKRNYWQCPTCGFRYRLERMAWGRWVSSRVTQVALTFTIFFLAMFVAGFFADPIINLYLDPYGTISSVPFSKLGTKPAPIITEEEDTSWAEHFIKGMASLGLLSFVKVLLALSPWQWWHLRSSGVIGGSGRAGNNGRDRLATINWLVVLIGIGTFIWVSTVFPKHCNGF